MQLFLPLFPMIPITVSFFTKEGEKEGNKPIKSALVYAIGIIVIYTSLGFLMALILGASGANQIASNPWMNLFIASLFIYFALSLFGMYEIELPSFIRQYSLDKESKGGIKGACNDWQKVIYLEDESGKRYNPFPYYWSLFKDKYKKERKSKDHTNAFQTVEKEMESYDYEARNDFKYYFTKC